jgi:alcohol dehydrogenase class IV
MHYLPTRIIYGENAVRKGFVYLNQLGKKALIVTGRHSAKASGALDDVLAILSQLRIAHALFDGVEENPVLETVMQGAAAFTGNSCDFIIGIGGGSPIDTAKAVSLVAANQLEQSSIYDLAKFKKAYPLVAVPTTAGTGTEATQYSVLTDASTQKKAGFGHDLAFPTLSLVDPRYTLSLSPDTTLNTAIDALSHLLEGIYSNKRNTLIFPLIFQGAALIYNNLKTVLNDPSEYAGREALMRASLYGGITISHSSTTLQHSIGYPLTSVYNVPHGLANGIVMQRIMELYYPSVQADLEALFSYMGISKDGFYTWLDSLGMNSGIRITADFIAAKIPEILASRNMANNPFNVTAEQVRAILESLQ